MVCGDEFCNCIEIIKRALAHEVQQRLFMTEKVMTILRHILRMMVHSMEMRLAYHVNCSDREA